MNNEDRFAIYILSYNRARNVKTLTTLINANYKGDWFIIVDDTDPELSLYKEIYEDKVLVFNKKEIAKKIDVMDTFCNYQSAIYARHYNFDIAKKMGYNYFMQLDDDYGSFYYTEDKDDNYVNTKITDINPFIEVFLHFLKKSNILTVSFAQGGDFLGGGGSTIFRKGYKRKAMNGFFFDVNKKANFLGSMNADVNMYLHHAIKGDICLTTRHVKIIQSQTQQEKGGITEAYLKFGTYVKSFYSVMLSPSSVTVQPMRSNTENRIHHHISWDNTTPMILNEKYKINGKNN